MSLMLVGALLGLFASFCPAVGAEEEEGKAGAKAYVPPRACVEAVPSEGKAPLTVTLLNCSKGDFDKCGTNFLYGNCVSAVWQVTLDDEQIFNARLCVSNSKHPGSQNCDDVKVTVRAPDGQPPNYWPQTESAMVSSDSDLALLRQYRDEYLQRSTKGKLYNELLYENSEEALQVLQDNPELVLRAKELIEANIDAVCEVLNGNMGTVRRADEIAAFLEDFAERSPATLKVLTRVVKQDMQSKFKRKRAFLGFKPEPEAGQP
jgi:hypothetical protein